MSEDHINLTELGQQVRSGQITADQASAAIQGTDAGSPSSLSDIGAKVRAGEIGAEEAAARAEALAGGNADTRYQRDDAMSQESAETAPGSPEGYSLSWPETLPNGITHSPEKEQQFRAWAHGQGWTNRQAQAAVDFYLRQMIRG
jgi:hypothetical protein